MNTRLTLVVCLVLAIAGQAAAQGAGYGGILGVYFSETQFDQSTMTIHTPPFVLLNAYIVLTDAQYDGVGAFECSITPMHELFIVLAFDAPAVHVNVGDLQNIMVGYPTPLPVSEDGTCVLGWLECLPLTDEQVDLVMGPFNYPSIPDWDGPAIVFEHDWNLIYYLDLSSGAHGYPDVVAIVNPEPIAVESRSLSDIKALFE